MDKRIVRNAIAAATMAVVAASSQATAFYFHAHPDDIELFMARQAANDITTPGAKVVMVLTTAGNYPSTSSDFVSEARMRGMKPQ